MTRSIGVRPLVLSLLILALLLVASHVAVRTGDGCGQAFDPEYAKLAGSAAATGGQTPMPPTDPLIYRLYELLLVNGPAWKAIIEEEFGDGIIPAIDISMEFEREPTPKGDRVKIAMSGRFLPLQHYGNQKGIPDYGCKES